MDQYNYYVVDAFTSELFKGNPAGVCPLNEWIPDDVMQKIAFENNLSETVFFVQRNSYFEIRWFTPKVEINLAGHPTLAAAHVLYNHLNYSLDKIILSSKSGELSVIRRNGIIILNFPAWLPVPLDIPPVLTEGLGLKPSATFKSRDLLALFNTEEEITSIKPRFDLLHNVSEHGIIITAPGNICDFVSRFFAPAMGINEDPVTGSAHSTLIPFWHEKLKKTDMHAFQLSERKGEIFCRYLGERVEIGGRAITYLHGKISC